MYRLFSRLVFGGDGDERVCELSIRVVFAGGGERVCELSGRVIFGGDGDERVYHLFSGFIFAGGGDRMHRMFGWDVLVRVWSEQREYVCAMPRRRVLERLRRECLCVMPARVDLFHTRIHVNHKLRLQRRVLRTERRRVCAMPGPIVL